MKHYILFVGDADEVLSPEYLTRLNNDFKNALNFLSSGTTVKDLGNMLTSGQLTSLTKSNAAPDGVEASFTLVIPGPLNNIEFIVDLSVG